MSSVPDSNASDAPRTTAPPTGSAPPSGGAAGDEYATRSGRRGAGGVRPIGILVIIAGIVLVLAGVTTYVVVTNTLADQKITVSDDAAHFAGNAVDTPWEAYAQASVIDKHAKEASGGKTYAELPQDDPKRDTVMTASFLQASLFTSVVAFGVAALVVGLGVVLLLIGFALLRLGGAVRRL